MSGGIETLPASPMLRELCLPLDLLQAMVFQAVGQGVEARAGERGEAQEGLSHGAGGGAADQLCGYRTDTAGRAPGAAAGGDFRFPRQPARDDRARAARLSARAEEAPSS